MTFQIPDFAGNKDNSVMETTVKAHTQKLIRLIFLRIFSETRPNKVCPCHPENVHEEYDDSYTILKLFHRYSLDGLVISFTLYLFAGMVASASTIVQISCGGFHGLALKPEGIVWAWGLNVHGQFSDRTNTDRKIPVQVIWKQI